MNNDTIRRTYLIGIIVAAVLFAAMLIDHFANDAALLVPLTIIFALVAVWLFVMLFLRPTEDTVTDPDTSDEVTGIMDYPGDVHEVVDLEGIGPTYADRLHAAGIFHTQELLFVDDDTVAKAVGTPVKTVQKWKAMAQLIKVSGIGPQYAEALVRGGVTGIEDLAGCDPEVLTRSVNAYLEELDSTVVGQSISEKRVTKWKRAAGRMKKVPIDLNDIQVRPLESKAARSDAATTG